MTIFWRKASEAEDAARKQSSQKDPFLNHILTVSFNFIN
ncbi:hypothetical protein HMPREF1487_08234 [Pseudomonas sp. HPB0071]|uniref:Uncharacterized protein n=1 Tax=Pseudomonas luteola TaxID=47886 RepID=A0A2X2EI43_PSELU|nr:hypothetical protein HMPREF1487_08234 [Pseudomonas sp. HPB0071]SPZ06360.1 Uncharacterised protein [Pseudomonas luteola]